MDEQGRVAGSTIETLTGSSQWKLAFVQSHMPGAFLCYCMAPKGELCPLEKAESRDADMEGKAPRQSFPP